MVECTALSLQTSAVVEVVVYWLSLSNGLSQADGHDTRERWWSKVKVTFVAGHPNTQRWKWVQIHKIFFVCLF